MNRTLVVSPAVCALLFAFFGTASQGNAAAVLRNLRVEYRDTPLGIDVAQPRFSWQMATTAGERGYAQTAYQHRSQGPEGQRRLGYEDGSEPAIRSASSMPGAPLKRRDPILVDGDGVEPGRAKLTASSWFETGLMDPAPDSSAWGGAKWIGGGDEDLVLYAPYLAIFDVQIRRDDRAGQHPRELRIWRQRLAPDGQEQEYLPVRERQRPELHQAGTRHLRRSTARRTARRSSTSTAPATRTPIRPHNRCGRSRSRPSVINSANKNAEHIVEFQQRLRTDRASRSTGSTALDGCSGLPARHDGARRAAAAARRIR